MDCGGNPTRSILLQADTLIPAPPNFASAPEPEPEAVPEVKPEPEAQAQVPTFPPKESPTTLENPKRIPNYPGESQKNPKES